MSIEQTIREMLDKKKAKAENLAEQVGADKVGDGPKMAPGQSINDEPNVKRNNTDQSVVSKGQGVDGKGSSDGKHDKKMMAPEGNNNTKMNKPTPGQTAKEELEIDVTDDVAALVDGEDLSEEFKTKAATIFEAAVVTRVKAEIAKLEEEFETRLQEQFEEAAEELVEHVDGYLNLMIEKWMEDNELALESGLKLEVMENFMSGMKQLFQDSYIDVPEDKFDLVGDLEEKVEVLTARLDEAVATNVELKKSLTEMERADLVSEAASGLTDVEVEKFTKLAEELAFEDTDSFKSKLQTIRESYFSKAKAGASKVLTESVVTDTPVELVEDVKKPSGKMAVYAQALEKFNK